MSVTAKVYLLSASIDSGGQTVLKFNAPYDGPEGRNAQWAKYTPSLDFSMTVKTEVYENNFTVGKEYLVTFEQQDA